MKLFKDFVDIKEAHDLLYLSEVNSLSVGILRKDFNKTGKLRVTKFAEKFFGKKKFEKKDGTKVTLKTIEYNGYEYTSKNDEEFSKVVKGFLKDFKKGTGNIKILDPKMPFGDLAKTDEFGGEEGGEKGKMTTFYKDFKISNNTEFIEFFQALGFILGSTLKDNEAGFVDKLQKVTITGKGDFETIGNDWEGLCKALYQEKTARKLVLELVNGSVSYKKEAGIKNPYVVWSDIKSYYSAMTTFEKITFTKENTADIVVIEGGKTLTDLTSALSVKGQTLSIDETYGKLTTVKEPVVSWYQVSLKEGESSARLGRVTGIFKNKYLDSDDVDKSNYANAVGESYNQSLNEFVELYNEGWFDSLKAVTKSVVDKLKQGVAKLKKLVAGAFNFFFKKQKMSNWKKQVKDNSKDIDAILKKYKLESKEGFEKRTGKNYVDRIAKYKRSLSESDEFLFEGAAQEEQMDLLMKSPKALKTFMKLVKSRLDTVEATAKSKKGTFHYIKRLGGGKGTTGANIQRDTLKMNMANSLSFLILDQMIQDFPSNNIMQYVTDIKDDMMMGSTGYPVVKLYGSNEGANFSILIRGVVGDKLDTSKVFPLVISIEGNSDNSYYVVNVYMISHSDAVPENCKFSLIQFTNSDTTFAYKIEGNRTFDYKFVQKKFKI
jgi:hypothetical protein